MVSSEIENVACAGNTATRRCRMDSKTVAVIESVGGLAQFEQLVEQGRQLHNQEIFELFARLGSKAIQSLKKSCAITIGKQGVATHSRGVTLKQTSRNPV
jgi:hypothetical protein